MMDLMRNLHLIMLGLWIGRLLNAASTVEASTATTRDPRGTPFEPSNASRFYFSLHRLGTRLSSTSNDDGNHPCGLLMCVFNSSGLLSSVISSFHSIDHLEI